MINPEQAAVLAALETQARQLTAVLGRLETSRTTLLSSITSWHGVARHAYQSAVDALIGTIDMGIAAVRSARDRTESAIGGMAARE